MHDLLVNSKMSDVIDSDEINDIIHKNPDLKERIIVHKTDISSFDQYEMKNFLKVYMNNINNKKPDSEEVTRMVGEFFLGEFFRKVNKETDYNLVHIQGDMGVIEKTDNYAYEFIANGKSIGIYDEKMKPSAEITRLVKIRRDKEKQVILCDFVQEYSKINYPKYHMKKRFVRDFLRSNYTLSYMFVYPEDIFFQVASPESRKGRYDNYRSEMESHLVQNQKDLMLIYTASTSELTGSVENI